MPERLQHLMIRASAGSGKTWQLSRRFIALLMLGVDPARIVALTFTRKAAEHFGWEYDSIHGDDGLMRALVSGDWDDERFLVLQQDQLTQVQPKLDKDVRRAVPRLPGFDTLKQHIAQPHRQKQDDTAINDVRHPFGKQFNRPYA